MLNCSWNSGIIFVGTIEELVNAVALIGGLHRNFKKSDWKLFIACIAEWQENYKERLVKEYIDMLNGNGNASDKFWELEERIKKDKKHLRVMLELSKENMIFDIVALINSGVITTADLERP